MEEGKHSIAIRNNELFNSNETIDEKERWENMHHSHNR